MTGLDKIIAQIRLDAESTCERINSKSSAECLKILENAKAEAQAVLEEGEAKALKKYDDIIARANSAAELEERKITLNAKQSVISTMISTTLESLRNLPDKEYFELIYKMISKYSEESEGVVSFSEKDLARLPADFEEKVSNTSKAKLTVNKAPVLIDGGFILTYGGVDVNCSFSALFSDNSEKISDSVARLLFA